MTYDFVFYNEMNKSVYEATDAILYKYGRKFTPPFYQYPFSIGLKDQDRIIGGVTGYFEGGFCYLDFFAIDEPYRDKGLGKALLEYTEQMALQKDCRGIWLKTVSFQAPDFYKKLGYIEFGRIENYPEGYDRIFFVKYF